MKVWEDQRRIWDTKQKRGGATAEGEVTKKERSNSRSRKWRRRRRTRRRWRLWKEENYEQDWVTGSVDARWAKGFFFINIARPFHRFVSLVLDLEIEHMSCAVYVRGWQKKGICFVAVSAFCLSLKNHRGRLPEHIGCILFLQGRPPTSTLFSQQRDRFLKN